MGVPMQRPKALGERTSLTEQEYAQRVAQAQKAADYILGREQAEAPQQEAA